MLQKYSPSQLAAAPLTYTALLVAGVSPPVVSSTSPLASGALELDHVLPSLMTALVALPAAKDVPPLPVEDEPMPEEEDVPVVLSVPNVLSVARVVPPVELS